jgi:predicted nucleotidyltransferase
MPPTPFETLLTKLADDGVRFVLVGAVAGLAHGLTRATYDVDVCYWRHPDNIERLCASLSALHPTLRLSPAPADFQFDPATVQALRDLPLDTDAGPVDLLAAIAGLGDYESLLNHAEELELFGRAIRVLTLDGLILAKKAVARPQDLADVAALEALRELRAQR